MSTAEEILQSSLAQFAQPELKGGKSAKYRRITEAAIDLFVRHGYRKTSIDEIAYEAGVAKGTVYLYFKSKADLLFHVMAQEKLRYWNEFRDLFDEDMDPGERLRQFIRKSLILGRRIPLAAKLINEDREIQLILEEADDDMREQADEARLYWLVEMIDEAAGRGRSSREVLEEKAVVLTNILYAAMRGEQYTDRGMVFERFAELLADTLVNGLANPGRMPS